jgi:hypothetical protein
MAQQTGEKFDNLNAPELYAAQFTKKSLFEDFMLRSELPGETL